jgi:hypothetical protein
MEKEKLLDDENFVKIIIDIPKNCVAFHSICEVYNDGEVVKLRGYYGPDDIRKCRNDYLELDPDDDYFGRWVLTDEAKKEILDGEIQRDNL